MAKEKNKPIRLNLPQNEDTIENNSKIIHLFYIIGILSVIVILLFAYILTVKVTDSSRLAPFASWTATILSIVLSILAIIYSYYSIRDTGLQMSQMKETLGAITATNQATNNIIHTLLKTVVSLHDKVSAIEAKQDLNNNINSPLASITTLNNVEAGLANKGLKTANTAPQPD